MPKGNISNFDQEHEEVVKIGNLKKNYRRKTRHHGKIWCAAEDENHIPLELNFLNDATIVNILELEDDDEWERLTLDIISVKGVIYSFVVQVCKDRENEYSDCILYYHRPYEVDARYNILKEGEISLSVCEALVKFLGFLENDDLNYGIGNLLMYICCPGSEKVDWYWDKN